MCIEGNGVHCLQTASFTFTGPLSPLTHHSGLCTERERENTGNRSGCVGISHLLLDDKLPGLWPLEIIPGAMRQNVLEMYICSLGTGLQFFTRDAAAYQKNSTRCFDGRCASDLHRRV